MGDGIVRVMWWIICLAGLAAPVCGGAGAATLRVASLMIRPVKWDKDANRARLERAIREAQRAGAELIVTPEGALEGYVVNEVIRATGAKRRELTERFGALAEPCDGPYIQHFRELCQELQVHLVLGFLEADAGKTYNTAILIRPDGSVGASTARRISPRATAMATRRATTRPATCGAMPIPSSKYAATKWAS